MYSNVYDFNNLFEAYKRSAKSKKYRKEVLDFSYNLEEILIEIQNELIWKTYKIGLYRHFKVFDPKERDVVALPFRDRVVQNALHCIVEPIFEKRMIYDSYACRLGKGTHKTANRISYFLGKPKSVYYLKADIKSYFASIDVGILFNIIKKYIVDENVLWLMQGILESPNKTGIPIGNLMSQLFANVYLHELDHYIKHVLGIKMYVRYMDDFLILHEDKDYLKTLLNDVTLFFDSHLMLRLNNKTKIDKCCNGIEFVGYRIWADNKLIKKQSIEKMKRKERVWEKGKMSDETFFASIGSWIGHSRNTSSHACVERLLLKSLKHTMNR